MDDWDTVTKIGSKTRGGGAARETTVRGKSALNAAARTGGIVATEKKYATGNAATKGGTDGQRMTKVDRSDDIVKVKVVGKKVGEAIQKRRLAMEPKMNREDLAKKTGSMSSNELATFESGSATFNAGKLATLERILQIKLLGSEDEIGKPKVLGPKKKAPEKK